MQYSFTQKNLHMIALLTSKLPLVCVRDADCKHLKATHQVVVKLGNHLRPPVFEVTVVPFEL